MLSCSTRPPWFAARRRNSLATSGCSPSNLLLDRRALGQMGLERPSKLSTSWWKWAIRDTVLLNSVLSIFAVPRAKPASSSWAESRTTVIAALSGRIPSRARSSRSAQVPFNSTLRSCLTARTEFVLRLCRNRGEETAFSPPPLSSPHSRACSNSISLRSAASSFSLSSVAAIS